MFEDRLKNLREEKHLNMKQTAQQLGIPYTTYVGYEKNEREPNSEALILLADYFGCSVDYLMGRSNNRIVATDEQFESNVSTVLPQEKIHMIPVYESVSAGFGAYADNYITEYIPLYIANDEEAKNTMCIVVSGNSMYPKIENGDKIQVLKQNWAESGQVVVALIDGENGVVKKIEYDKDTVRLISINPEYPPREFQGSEKEQIQILGVVKTVIKKL